MDKCKYYINNKELCCKDAFIDELLMNTPLSDINKALPEIKSIPNTPFKKTDQWVRLAVRRLLVYAAENGYDQVTWTTGEKQADRYDLSKQVDAIEWVESGKRKYITLIGLKGASSQDLEVAIDKETGVITTMDLGSPQDWTGKHLSDVVGKEISEKILSEKEGRLQDDGLKVGGEGMKSFYNQIVPKVISKEVKRFGIKPGQTQINITPDIQDGINTVTGEVNQSADYETAHSIYLNDELKKSVLEGMPMFRIIGEGEVPGKQFAGNLITDPSKKARNTQVTQIWNSLLSQSDADIKIVKTHKDLPAWIKSQLGNSKPKGVHVGGVSYLVADAQTDVVDAVKTFIHEVGIHEGLARIIPNNQQRIKFLEKVVDDIGLDELSKIVDPADIQDYKDGKITKDILGEEYIAYLAEKKLSGKDLVAKEKTIWQQFIDWVNKQINNLLNTNVKITEDDILDIARASLQSVFQARPVNTTDGRAVSDVQKPLRDGNKNTQAPAESRVRFAGDILSQPKSRKLAGKKDMEPEVNLAEKVKQILIDRGVESHVWDYTVSRTTWGTSVYFQDFHYKVRISDHDVMSERRMEDEKHFTAKADPENVANAIEMAEYPERFEKVKTGVIYKDGYGNEFTEKEVENGYAWTTKQIEASPIEGLEGREDIKIVKKDFVRTSKKGRELYDVVYKQRVRVTEYPTYERRRKNEKKDQNQSDIKQRRSKEPGTREMFSDEKDPKEKILNNLGEVRKFFSDRDVAIEKFQDIIKKLGGKVIPEADVALAINLYKSRKLEKEKMFNRELLEPVMDTLDKLIKKSGETYLDIQRYMQAKHAPGRNREIIQKERKRINDYYDDQIERLEELNKNRKRKLTKEGLNKDRQRKLQEFNEDVKESDNFSGFTTTQAEIAIERFEEKVGDKKLIELFWSQIKAMNHYALQQQYEGDVISKQLYEDLLSRSKPGENFEYYVPLKNWDKEDEPDFDYIKDIGGIFTSPIKTAKGRKTKAADPLPYIINAAYSAIIQNEKNRVKKSAARLITENKSLLQKNKMAGFTKVWVVQEGYEEITEEGVKQIVLKEKEVFTKPDESLFKAGKVRTKRSNPSPYKIKRTKDESFQHEVEVFFNGEKYAMWFHESDPSVSNAINMKLPERIMQANALINKIGLVTRFQAGNYTMRNINFVIGNLFRDVPLAVWSNLSEMGIKGGSKFAGGTVTIQPTLRRAVRDKLDPDNEMDRLFMAYRDGGGRTGFSFLKDVKAIGRETQRKMKWRTIKGKNKLVGAPVDALAGAIKGIEAAAEWSEDISRFATYVAYRKQGKTHLESLKAAKNVTINFDKKGMLNGVLGGLYAFFNAGIRGVVRIGQIAVQSPWLMGGGSLYLMSQGFISALLTDLLGGLDPDDEDYETGFTRYDYLSDYAKYNYLNIPAVNVRVPMPHILRLPHSLGVAAYDVASGRETMEEALIKFAGRIPGEFLPINPTSFVNRKGNFSFDPLIPTPIKPITDLMRNENFMGLPVYDEPFTKKQEKYTANAYQHFKTVGPMFEKFSKTLYKAAGGNELGEKYVYKNGKVRRIPGIMDINPEWIEHMWQGYFGGVGKLVNQMSKTAEMTVSAAQEYLENQDIKEALTEYDPSDMPIVYQFISSSGQDPLTSFWFDQADEMSEFGRVFDNAVKMEDAGKIKEMLSDKATMKKYALYKVFSKRSSEIRKEMEKVTEGSKEYELLKQQERELKIMYKKVIDRLSFNASKEKEVNGFIEDIGYGAPEEYRKTLK